MSVTPRPVDHAGPALTAIACLLLLVPGPLLAETLVADYRGSASRHTPEFEVRAPWILEWRVTTEGAHDSAVEVSLESAPLGVHEGRVLMTKQPGNGVRLFRRDGRFTFRVDASFANWSLRVIELTEEEAAAYTPRSASPLDR